ncbi:hypothetical protein CR205_07655 [Alteribacter lacisalsi]|uniref:DUF2663 family protein n=1 Tax=Alteribacter lacisalsi TaxID=2045244 RepID=A0A2W0HBB0_9BACI|nr:DUF2663 family protein [Alteribacter lacisalsi]PYZ98457.1 hypothetical protein CR205_07655 [Alteribacter lacisalsi]
MSGKEKSAYEAHIVNALIKAKQKEIIAAKVIQRAGCLHLIVLWITILYMAAGIFMRHHSSAYITAILHDPVILILLACAILTFKYTDMKRKSLDKAERDLDRLRSEVIDRAGEIWSGENRDEIYAEMLKDYRINLYHK